MGSVGVRDTDTAVLPLLKISAASISEIKAKQIFMLAITQGLWSPVSGATGSGT